MLSCVYNKDPRCEPHTPVTKREYQKVLDSEACHSAATQWRVETRRGFRVRVTRTEVRITLWTSRTLPPWPQPPGAGRNDGSMNLKSKQGRVVDFAY